MSGTQIKQPSVSIALANADATVQNTDQKVLIVGQQTAAATAVSGELQENIASSGAPESTLFGADSQLAGAIRGFKKVNKVCRIDAIGLEDNAAGVPRVMDFSIGGPATAAGTVTVRVASELDHEYVIAVASADSETDIADAITTAVTADTECPYDCANTLGAVTLTAVNDGTIANGLGVEVIIDAAGVSLAVDLTETTAGSLDPTLTGVLDVATERYQGIVWPYEDETVVETYLTAREDTTNSVLDGVAFLPYVGTLVGGLLVANALNSRSLTYFGDKDESEVASSVHQYLGPAQFEASYVKLALFAGIRAIRMTTGQNIASFLTSSASLDQFGGPALASLPYANTPMDYLPTIKTGRGWTDLEIEQLTTAGMSVMGVNVGGTGALVGEVVTTFKTDAASNPDPTFKFLNYVDTTSQAREYFVNNYKSRYAQTRLTQGSVSRGRDMANAVTIRAYTEKLYQDLSGDDYVLVQSGDAANLYFKENLTISLDLTTGTVTITMLVPIVTQLRTIVATMKISFSTSG